MKVIYCKNWWRSKKKIRGPLDREKALHFFDQGEHFFVVMYQNNSEMPTHFIEIFDKRGFAISVLDESLDEVATFSYQSIKTHPDIDSNKYFLTRLVVREKGENGKQIRGTAYNPVISTGNDEKTGEAIWDIQHNVFCEENDFIKKETSNFYSENKVDINSLYKDIPEFGDWEPLITDTQMRFLDE